MEVPRPVRIDSVRVRMSSDSCIREATSGWRVLRLGILIRVNVTLKSMLQPESTNPQSQTIDISTKPRKAEPGHLDSYARVLSPEVRLERKTSKCWNPRQHSSANITADFPPPTPATCTSTPAPRPTFGGTQIAGTRGMERKRPVLLLLSGGS